MCYVIFVPRFRNSVSAPSFDYRFQQFQGVVVVVVAAVAAVAVVRLSG